MTIREIVNPRIRFFQNAQQYAVHHVMAMSVPCNKCGAKAGEYCIDSRYRKRTESKSPTSPHIPRRDAMTLWKRNHPEWHDLCDEAFQTILKLRIKEQPK